MKAFTKRLLLVVAAVALVLGVQQRAHARQLATAREIAAVLGYKPEDEVATGFPCYEIIPDCWVYLYFKTEKTRDEVQALVDTLPFEVRQAAPTSGDNLESHMSYTNRRFVVTGLNPQYVKNLRADPETAIRKWYTVNCRYRTLVVTAK
ncbi:MAG: hypothetical protein H7Z42_16390 [Roseiflexaceae bacterium]|nr:hypothetical protein [Roseiflexaceae bacterium]